MKLAIYQTLEDRSNPEHIEDYGPFECKNPNAWLGFGFYFWDAHIELGHWWGKLNFYSKYVICKARATLDEFCWDLQGNGLHRIEFEKICNQFIENNVDTKNNILVPEIIEFFKLHGAFKYQSIRAMGARSIGEKYLNDNTLIFRMNFQRNLPGFLDLKPAVQICLLTKTALSLQNYKIIYPSDYSEYYA